MRVSTALDTQARRDDYNWRGREAIRHLRSVGFDHLGAAQQELFRFGNGFHTFVEPCDYEVVGPLTGPAIAGQPPVEDPETTAECIAKARKEHAEKLVEFRKRKAARDAARAAIPKRLTLAQQDARLPDLHREEGPIATTIFIKGYDKPIAPAHHVLSADAELQLEFGKLLIAAGKSVDLIRDGMAFRTVSAIGALSDSFYRGWRLNPERYGK